MVEWRPFLDAHEFALLPCFPLIQFCEAVLALSPSGGHRIIKQSSPLSVRAGHDAGFFFA